MGWNSKKLCFRIELCVHNFRVVELARWWNYGKLYLIRFKNLGVYFLGQISLSKVKLAKSWLFTKKLRLSRGLWYFGENLKAATKSIVLKIKTIIDHGPELTLCQQYLLYNGYRRSHVHRCTIEPRQKCINLPAFSVFPSITFYLVRACK